VLPEDNFVREDGKTPHIRHAERSALILQDHLLTTDMPPEEQIVRLSIEYGHDSEEEPQEMLMRNRDEGLPLNARGGMTQEQTKVIFDEEMEGIDDELRPFAEKIYDGIHAFNCHNADDSTKFDEDYLTGLRTLKAEKVVDRGMDSPQGDMSRIARMVESALVDPEKLATLYADLAPRYDRLEISINKATRLKPFAQTAPEEIQEFLEATIRAGHGFKTAVDTMLAEQGITLTPPRSPRRKRWIPSISSLFSSQ